MAILAAFPPTDVMFFIPLGLAEVTCLEEKLSKRL
jgi:hypothetical protein